MLTLCTTELVLKCYWLFTGKFSNENMYSHGYPNALSVFKAVGSSRGIAQTERVINYLEQSDERAASCEAEDIAESVKVSLEVAAVTTTPVSDSIS
jgi:hypothetical protein